MNPGPAKRLVDQIRNEADLEESRVQVVTAALAEVAGPEFLRLLHILGSKKTLQLMLSLPGERITVPNIQEVVNSLSTAAAALAVIQKRMKFDEARYHYQISAKSLNAVMESVFKLNKRKLEKIGLVRDEAMHKEVDKIFNRLGQMEMEYL